MAEPNFAVVESGESQEPTYDSSTHMVTEAGEKREPRIDESVRAAFEKHKSEKDPVFRFTKQLERNGKTLPTALGVLEEFDNASMRDPIDPYHLLASKMGHNPQAVAQHLYNGTNAAGAASQADRIADTEAIARFDARHNDPLSKELRPLAQKVLERGDKRLNGLTRDEMLDRAFGIAWSELPQNKARFGPSKILNDRDDATAKIKARMASKDIG